MDPTLKGGRVPVPTAQPQRTSGLFTKQTWLIILAIGLTILIGSLLLVSSGDRSLKLLPVLSARQATTLKIVADGQKNLTDRDLRKLNSELNIILAGDNASIQTSLKRAGLSEISAEVKAAEADISTFKHLDNAKVNGQYDKKYKTVIVQKLTSLSGLLREIHDETKSKSLRQALATEYEHISIHLREIEDL
ncbi:hypothetical protein E6P97_04155 [Patescibacteria group bacterium]|nr:MAG: hypothetical protein E6P97_04155 [Patescibacteria group bacterium]